MRLDRADPDRLPVGPERIRSIWSDAAIVPIDVTGVWLHGDLHPGNVIVDDGRLAAVVDWGDIGVGDPATDLAAAWMQFPTGAHDEFWGAYGSVSEATWKRARGWAIHFGLMLVDSGGGHDEAWAESGSVILERACS
jgi:aminoglycoside phosphotransferase (APT) family kinase protein